MGQLRTSPKSSRPLKICVVQFRCAHEWCNESLVAQPRLTRIFPPPSEQTGGPFKPATISKRFVSSSGLSYLLLEP